MAAKAMVHVRVDETVKAQAAETLASMGLSLSEYFTFSAFIAMLFLYPFDDLLFVGGLRLSVQDHFKRVLFL